MQTDKLTEPFYVLPSTDEQSYVARLAGAGSLRRELESLLSVAPAGALPDTLRNLVLRSNVTGKSSASARLWVWKRLKLRYVLDPRAYEYRAFTVGMRSATNPDDRGLLCLLMFARTDRLFREVALECVSPYLPLKDTTIDPRTIQAVIQTRVDANGLKWSPKTLDRAQSHLLAALKDFGVLRGSLQKRTVIPRPSPTVILFASWLGRLEGLTDRQLTDAVWFRLLGFERDRIVDLLYSAARAGTLGFRMQADVVEIDLPPLEEGVT